jgi:hypothetical protein
MESPGISGSTAKSKTAASEKILHFVQDGSYSFEKKLGC